MDSILRIKLWYSYIAKDINPSVCINRISIDDLYHNGRVDYAANIIRIIFIIKP